MTPKYFHRLEQVLDDSHLSDSPAELDQVLLSAARERANDVERTRLMPRFSAAAAALVLTIATLAAMQSLITPDQPEHGLTQQLEVVPFVPVSKEPTQEPIVSRIERPLRPKIIIPPTQIERDRVLHDLAVPNSDSVIAIWELPVASHELVSQHHLDAALNEIQAHINKGELDSARQRYVALVQSCKVCELPNSLEALILGSQGSRVSNPQRLSFLNSA